MPKYQIKYAGNGRTDGCEWETIEAKSLEAWQRATDDFENYAHGYIDDDDMLGLSEDEKSDEWFQVCESVIDYQAREFKLD